MCIGTNKTKPSHNTVILLDNGIWLTTTRARIQTNCTVSNGMKSIDAGMATNII
jgi:hypothetical protein